MTALRFGADVWHCSESPRRLRELSATVDALARAAGRDPASIVRASSLSLSEPWGQVRANAEAMRGRVSALSSASGPRRAQRGSRSS